MKQAAVGPVQTEKTKPENKIKNQQIDLRVFVKNEDGVQKVGHKGDNKKSKRANGRRGSPALMHRCDVEYIK